MEVKKNIPSRRLSTFEFFTIIQLEYIVAVLRSKIYVKVKDRVFWKKVAAGKYQTILEIAERNSLPSIFTDSDLSADLNRRVYRVGYPQFVYKNEEQKLSLEYTDSLYYYAKNSDVRFELNGEVVVAKVVSYKPLTKEVVVQIGVEEPIKVDISICARIL